MDPAAMQRKNRDTHRRLMRPSDDRAIEAIIVFFPAMHHSSPSAFIPKRLSRFIERANSRAFIKACQAERTEAAGAAEVGLEVIITKWPFFFTW